MFLDKPVQFIKVLFYHFAILCNFIYQTQESQMMERIAKIDVILRPRNFIFAGIFYYDAMIKKLVAFKNKFYEAFHHKTNCRNRQIYH